MLIDSSKEFFAEYKNPRAKGTETKEWFRTRRGISSFPSASEAWTWADNDAVPSWYLVRIVEVFTTATVIEGPHAFVAYPFDDERQGCQICGRGDRSNPDHDQANGETL